MTDIDMTSPAVITAITTDTDVEVRWNEYQWVRRGRMAGTFPAGGRAAELAEQTARDRWAAAVRVVVDRLAE